MDLTSPQISKYSARFSIVQYSVDIIHTNSEAEFDFPRRAIHIPRLKQNAILTSFVHLRRRANFPDVFLPIQSAHGALTRGCSCFALRCISTETLSSCLHTRQPFPPPPRPPPNRRQRNLVLTSATFDVRFFRLINL